MEILISVADKSHIPFSDVICNMMADAAKIRGTGIAKRTPDYITQKIKEGKAVIAMDKEQVAGFCYIESWENEKYVANSGLIVHPDYRKTGLAYKIKTEIFKLSKTTFPNAKLFGITTSNAVMKINAGLGYKPVTFSELTKDDKFWKGCQSCTNYDILMRTERKMCLCTGMICDLKSIPDQEEISNENVKKNASERFLRFLKYKKLRLRAKTKRFPKLFKNG